MILSDMTAQVMSVIEHIQNIHNFLTIFNDLQNVYTKCLLLSQMEDKIMLPHF